MNKMTTVLAGLLGLAIPAGAVGCAASDTDPPAETAQVHQRVDGLTAFQGLFLGKGPIADRLPEIFKDVPDQTRAQISGDPQRAAASIEAAAQRAVDNGWAPALAAQAKALADRLRKGEKLPQMAAQDQTTLSDLLVSRIKEKDPTFFDRFGDQVQSGNPLLVEKGLRDGREMMKIALASVIDGGNVDRGFDGAWYAGPRDVAITVEAVVAGVALAVTAFVVLFWLILPDEMSDGLSGTSKLGTAEVIHLISERLAA